MQKFLVSNAVALAALAASGAAQAQVLFSNGPVVDSTGVSLLVAPANGLGSLSNSTQALADDFSFTGMAWSVQSLDFFAYQTGAVGFTFTSVTWSILAGTAINSASVVASGTTSVTNGGLVGFRASAATPTLTNRAIYRINADIPDVELSAGSYFVTFALAGTSASGPFVPPVLGSLGTGNALFNTSTIPVFRDLIDAGASLPYDLPFQIQGSVVPEPSTYAMLLAGGLGVLVAVRRRRQR